MAPTMRIPRKVITNLTNRRFLKSVVPDDAAGVLPRLFDALPDLPICP